MRIETKCIQKGYEPKNGEPRVMPIVQSTTYKYDSSEFVSELFDLKAEGHLYSRISNPTVGFVEEKIAALENGVGALLTSSGQSAIMIAITNICKAGDHVLASTQIYGGATNLFTATLAKLGISFDFVDPSAEKSEIQKFIKENTKAIFAETLSNPTLDVLDIEKFASVAQENKIPLIIDNTFATPINCNPFEYGANIVLHSTSKYMDGHACVLGGAIVDGGNFDWSSGKFEDFTTPDPAYHGLVYSETFGNAAYIVKARTHLLRDMGCVMSAHSAFLLNLGLETLHLRMKQHNENALAVATYLEKNPNVTSVNYPGLKNSKYYDLAQKYIPNGQSGVVSFEIKGNRNTAMKFIDDLSLIALVVHVADARSSAIHPASTTHRQLSDEQLKTQNISPTLIRLSVGIENVQDILEDLEKAFAAMK